MRAKRSKPRIVKCQYCGKEFKTYNCYLKRGQSKYCSRECYHKNPSIRKGKINKITVICNTCGKKFKAYKSSNRKFCSHKCANSENMNLLSGKLSPHWKGGLVQKTCLACGRKFKVKQNVIKKGYGIYCSKKCQGVLMRKENSPNWKGGYKAFRERQKSNLKYRLNSRIKCLIYYSLKKGIKNNRHWYDLVNYNVKQLEKRLKSTMPDGYTWKDFLNGDLHIDHIIPVSAFYFEKPEDFQFQECWALSNLRLLSAKENYIKRAKIIKTFQMSLQL